MYATLASRDVDLCLIPESPFYLEGEGGLFEYVEKTLKDEGHMVIVVAEGAGQELLTKSLESANAQDASGNKLLQDVGWWISHRIKVLVILLSLILCSLIQNNCRHVLFGASKGKFIICVHKDYELTFLDINWISVLSNCQYSEIYEPC